MCLCVRVVWRMAVMGVRLGAVNRDSMRCGSFRSRQESGVGCVDGGGNGWWWWWWMAECGRKRGVLCVFV